VLLDEFGEQAHGTKKQDVLRPTRIEPLDRRLDASINLDRRSYLLNSVQKFAGAGRLFGRVNDDQSEAGSRVIDETFGFSERDPVRVKKLLCKRDGLLGGVPVRQAEFNRPIVSLNIVQYERMDNGEAQTHNRGNKRIKKPAVMIQARPLESAVSIILHDDQGGK
jgi:hypothetical protein